jgi:DNA-directed RNA polymerase subunit RPC12/RpoP
MARIKVKCGRCKHEFWINEYKNEACPKCGQVVRGPKAK